jgi:hypothetical protein
VQEKEVGSEEGTAGEVVVPHTGVQQKMPWAEQLAAVQQQERKQLGEAWTMEGNGKVWAGRMKGLLDWLLPPLSGCHHVGLVEQRAKG